MIVIRNCRLVKELTEGFDGAVGDVYIDNNRIAAITAPGSHPTEEKTLIEIDGDGRTLPRGAGVKVNGVQGRIWSASLSARSAALRAAGFFAVAKREAAPCGNHPDEVGAIRHGTAATGIAEEHSVPEGQSKSEQAPIRRPPLRAEGHSPLSLPTVIVRHML